MSKQTRANSLPQLFLASFNLFSITGKWEMLVDIWVSTSWWAHTAPQPMVAWVDVYSQTKFLRNVWSWEQSSTPGAVIAADKQNSEPLCLDLQEVMLLQILIPSFKIIACNRETSYMFSTDGKCFHLLFFFFC